MLRELILALLIPVVPDAYADKPGIWKEQESVCMAMNIYHEARNQGLAGQLAVAAVTLNRVADKRYPNTVCEVVKQGPIRESWKTKGKDVRPNERQYYPIRHKCQFSWYCDGKSDEINQPKSYGKILDLSRLIIYNDIAFVDITEGATHYHADYVMPAWAKTKTKTIEIEDHIFYRWEKSK